MTLTSKQKTLVISGTVFMILLIIAILVLILTRPETTPDASCPVETTYGKKQFCNEGRCKDVARVSFNSSEIKFDGTGTGGGFLFRLPKSVYVDPTKGSYSPFRSNNNDTVGRDLSDGTYGFGNPGGLTYSQVFFMDSDGTIRWVKNAETLTALIRCLSTETLADYTAGSVNGRHDWVHILSTQQAYDFVNAVYNEDINGNATPITETDDLVTSCCSSY